MSDDLYRTRLRWSGHSGVAMLHGARVALTEAPVLCGMRVAAIDYTPEVGCFEIRRGVGDRMEEMTQAEIAAADELLAAAVRPKTLL